MCFHLMVPTHVARILNILTELDETGLLAVLNACELQRCDSGRRRAAAIRAEALTLASPCVASFLQLRDAGQFCLVVLSKFSEAAGAASDATMFWKQRFLLLYGSSVCVFR